MMLTMVARTAPLPAGGTLCKVKLLAVRFSPTFTYLKVV
jgi:hypothetical protein